MQPLQLLTLIRAIATDTITACNRREYLASFIYRIHRDKIQAVNDRIARDVSINKAVKAKYFREINKLALAPIKVKDYTLIREQVSAKLLTLTSAIDFMKKG